MDENPLNKYLNQIKKKTIEKDTQEYLILKSIHDGEETIKQRVC